MESVCMFTRSYTHTRTINFSPQEASVGTPLPSPRGTCGQICEGLWSLWFRKKLAATLGVRTEARDCTHKHTHTQSTCNCAQMLCGSHTCNHTHFSIEQAHESTDSIREDHNNSDPKLSITQAETNESVGPKVVKESGVVINLLSLGHKVSFGVLPSSPFDNPCGPKGCQSGGTKSVVLPCTSST